MKRPCYLESRRYVHRAFSAWWWFYVAMLLHGAWWLGVCFYLFDWPSVLATLSAFRILTLSYSALTKKD